jgi:hypothetical protein
MPRTWKEDTLFREEVLNGNVSWKLILKRPSNRHPNTVIDKYYSTKTETYQKKGRRIIWIKSSQKQEVDQLNRDERIQQSVRELNAINSKINRYNLKQLNPTSTRKKCNLFIIKMLHLFLSFFGHYNMFYLLY